MAQKKIRDARVKTENSLIEIVYDNGGLGEIDIRKAKNPDVSLDRLAGLTLKQARILLGVKS